MRNNLFQKRMPTAFAFLTLIGGLFITALLVQQGISIISRASPNDEPQNMQVTNITNNSFTVAFTTVDPVIAAVNIENSDPQMVVYDQRNPEGNQKYVSHSIVVKDLNPETKYTYTILSNGNVYRDGESSFTTTTARGNAPNSSKSFSLKGSVLLPDGTPCTDVLVFVKIPNTAAISAVTNGEGVYSIPTDLIRNPSHEQIVTLTPKTKLDLTAMQGGLTSHITYLYQPGSEIPTISLSQNYSFIASEDESSISTPSSNLALPTGTNRDAQVKITTPRDGQTFTDLRPQFQGSAAPNSLVKIAVPPGIVQIQLKASPNGTWSYRSGVAIPVGKHTLTVQAQNGAGVQQTKNADFTILASGSQVAESATPSAQPTFTPTPTVTIAASIAPSVSPTQSVSPTGTISPTVTIVPTIPPTIAPTIPLPSPTVVVVPPQKTVPPTGTTTQTLFLTTVAILFIVAGSALLFVL